MRAGIDGTRRTDEQKRCGAGSAVGGNRQLERGQIDAALGIERDEPQRLGPQAGNLHRLGDAAVRRPSGIGSQMGRRMQAVLANRRAKARRARDHDRDEVSHRGTGDEQPTGPGGEAEQLAAQEDSPAYAWDSVSREWKSLREKSEGLDAAVEPRYAAAETTIRERAEAKKAAVEKAFAGLPTGTRPALAIERTRPGAPAREAVTMKGKANMNFIYGEAGGPRLLDADYEAALVANAALGQTSLTSRIGKRVRDTEGLSYSLSSRFQLTDVLDGVWAVNVNVAPQNLAKALKSTREEIEKYCADGITEPENAFGEMFGEERLIEMVHRHAHLEDGELVKNVLDSVRGWTGSPELHDDMTLLVARQVQSK